MKINVNLILVMLFGAYSFAQENTITGIVLDAENQQPLPGATISIDGTSEGTTTDFDGKYSLNVSQGDVLTFEYVGFQKLSQTVGQESVINVSLSSDNELEEVIVVGYGTQKRSNVVGSVATVDVKKAAQIPTTNVTELLRGRAAGVQVNLGDARPGGFSNIVIRGNVSVAGGNNPLIIVDGLPYDNLNDISPDDISSVEILKDAASTAIYGSRASNGVVLVTTKRARSGYSTFNYAGYVTTQTLTRNFDQYNAPGFFNYKMDAWRARTGLDNPPVKFVWEEFELELIENQNFVNWEDLALNDALLTSHSMSYSSATDKSSIYSSLNYFTQDGIIPNSGFDRLQYKLNYSNQLTEKLSLDAILNVQNAKQNRETGGLFLASLSPIAKPYDDEGNLVKYFLGEQNAGAVNPLWDQRESVDETETNLTDISLRFNYDILPNLTYSLKTFFRNRNTDQGTYRSSRHSAGDEGNNGIGVLIDTQFKQILVEHILNYNILDGDDHKLDFTGVHAYDEQNFKYNQLDKSDFVNDALGYNGLASELLSNNRGLTRRRVLSYMGRVRYSFQDKYLFELTTRADGASVFAENKKWGYFPAVSAAYKLDKDLKLDYVDQLKLRLSYGTTGNQGVDPTESLGVANYNPYIFGNTVVSGSSASSRLRNPDLKWESTRTLNAGVDFALFSNKFRGTLEYYKSNTVDLLLDRQLASSTGYNVTRFNVGELQNTGLEVTLNNSVINTKNLSFDLGVVWSTNSNEIISLTGETQVDPNTGEEYFIDITESNGRRLSIGQSINNLWLPEYAGIYQEADFLEGSPITPEIGAKPGHIRVVDQDNNGVIDIDDNVFINADPDWYGSINATLRYKNFDLFMDWYAVQGVTRINSVLSNGEFWKASFNGPVLPYYTDQAPSTKWPKANATAAWLKHLNSFAAQDASYLRLRTVTVGYNFSDGINNYLKTKSGRLYFTGTNLLTLTDFLSYSPEQDLRAGVFPETLNMTVGLKLTF
ncbi:MAG: SusC/RagA family TonB-linked outer membrane protein [Flavobacteriaceae bacterium]